MPSSENNNNILPTENVITEIKFGNSVYEIGLGASTREEIEDVFEDINDNFDLLNTTIEENEETVSSSLNDLESRKADKSEVPTVPTNVSAFTNDAGYLTQHQSLSDYATKNWVEAKNYLTSHQDISAYFNDVEYDSNSKRINFKNGNTVKKYIDATDFIKDGMVDSVTIGNVTIDSVLTKCLIITFNTDSGKENINIPLTDIFDPDEYYTKDDIDDSERAIAAALTDLQATKANSIDLSMVATSGSYNDLANKPTYTLPIPYGTVTSTSTTVITATVQGVTSLSTGVMCLIKNGANASASGWTLDVNGLGAKPVFVTTNTTTRSTTQFAANYLLMFIYNEELDSNNGGWLICQLFNSNTTYSVMSLNELRTGTATSSRTLSAQRLKQAYYISGQTITIASDSLTVPKLYSTTGDATDGAMTQSAVTEALQEFNCGEY